MMHTRSVAAIVLAAGKGTRMKSDLPKVLHAVCGLPMVELVARAVRDAGVSRIVLVIGHGGEELQKRMGDGYEYAWQREQLGTGHAAQMASAAIADHDGPVLIVPGDAPLLDASAIQGLIEHHERSKAECTVATAVIADPKGYGRIVRDAQGRPARIVEEKDATPEQRAIREVNTSLYCFDGASLAQVLPRLSNQNAQGEYYLTDTVQLLHEQGQSVETFEISDAGMLVGVNDRWQLAEAENELRRRLLRQHALNGVTILSLDTVFVGADVTIEPDVVLEASTHLAGSTHIEHGARIGPCTRIEDARIGSNTTVLMSHVVGATLGANVWCGPFANVRPGSTIENGARVGNFVEIKNSVVESDAKVSHLSYIGDAHVGARTNIGAGTITCNFNGYEKNKTFIGEDAFIGSHSTLVAPVNIGSGTVVAAGSTITEDVPDDAGAFGRARQVTKDGWGADWRKRMGS